VVVVFIAIVATAVGVSVWCLQQRPAPPPLPVSKLSRRFMALKLEPRAL